MAETRTLDEVFQIAMELEETGQVFYETMAVVSQDHEVASLCRRLAQKESEHYDAFKEMRQAELGDRAGGPMDLDQSRAVQDMINEQVIPDPKKIREVAGHGGMAEALSLALEMENSSVEFFGRMLEVVSEADARVVQAIIAEEHKHVKDISAALNSLG